MLHPACLHRYVNPQNREPAHKPPARPIRLVLREGVESLRFARMGLSMRNISRIEDPPQSYSVGRLLWCYYSCDQATVSDR